MVWDRTKAHHGQKALSQLLRQKQVWNVSAMLLSQHMPGQDLLKGTEYRENNIDPIYILLGNKPTET